MISRCLAVVVACGMGCNNANSVNQVATKPGQMVQLPLRIDQDGWHLTEDCIVNLDSEPYVKDSPSGKFLFAKSVTIKPTGRSEVTFKIRPAVNSIKDTMKNTFPRASIELSIIKLHASAIPLPESMGFATGDRFIICGGKEGNVLGGEVVSKVVTKDTKIMPVQSAEVVDSNGAVVVQATP